MAREPRDTDRAPNPSDRSQKRAILGGSQLKLTAKKRDGFHRRIFNNKPGRLKEALDAGYLPVEDDAAKTEDGRASNQTYRVGTLETGQEMTGHLMEKLAKHHEEDQAIKQAPINETEEAIFGSGDPVIENPGPGGGGKYYKKRSDRSAT